MDMKAQASKLPWFHAIDFGEFQSAGRFTNGIQQNATLFAYMELMRSIDVSGMSCLDIGAQSGLVSFGLKKLGAQRVVACDTHDIPSFGIAKALLGLDVEYLPGIQTGNFENTFRAGEFDLAVCAGVIYHMLNPMSAFTEVRRILKKNGLAFFESAYISAEKRPVLTLNSETQTVFERSTFWLPSERSMVGMLRLAGFSPIAVRHTVYPERITVLGKAVDKDEVSGATPLLKKMFFPAVLDRSWRAGVKEESAIIFNGEYSSPAIDGRTSQVSYPYHVPNPANPVGADIVQGRRKNA